MQAAQATPPVAGVLLAVGCLRRVVADSLAVACRPPGAVDFLVVGCRTAEGSVVAAAAEAIAKTGSEDSTGSGTELKRCSWDCFSVSPSDFGFGFSFSFSVLISVFPVGGFHFH